MTSMIEWYEVTADFCDCNISYLKNFRYISVDVANTNDKDLATWHNFSQDLDGPINMGPSRSCEKLYHVWYIEKAMRPNWRCLRAIIVIAQNFFYSFIVVIPHQREYSMQWWCCETFFSLSWKLDGDDRTVSSSLFTVSAKGKGDAKWGRFS